MMRTVVTGEEAVELKRLYVELAASSKKALTVLEFKGMDSKEFLEADTQTGKLWRRIREILGAN